jgi:putative ubiquitin-RnfH superfamily antitoxin RatB of RatAB toxin-antitoxin module
MKVQVIYAESDRMLNCWVEVEGQATVADCLLRAAVSEEFVNLDIRQFDVGIFGERCEPERVGARQRSNRALSAFTQRR